MPKISRIGDKSSQDQIIGGAKKPRPLFRSVEINRGPKLGGHGPLSPLKTFFLASSRPHFLMIALAFHLPALSAKGLHRLSPCRKHPFLSFRHHGRSKKLQKRIRTLQRQCFDKLERLRRMTSFPWRKNSFGKYKHFKKGEQSVVQ